MGEVLRLPHIFLRRKTMRYFLFFLILLFSGCAQIQPIIVKCNSPEYELEIPNAETHATEREEK
jgi:hypothetical protein